MTIGAKAQARIDGEAAGRRAAEEYFATEVLPSMQMRIDAAESRIRRAVAALKRHDCCHYDQDCEHTQDGLAILEGKDE